MAPLTLTLAHRLRRHRAVPLVATLLFAIVVSLVAGIALVKLGSAQRELKAVLILVAAAAMVAAALRPNVGLLLLITLVPFEYHFTGTGTDEVLLVATAVVLA